MLARADSGEQQTSPEILSLDILAAAVCERVEPSAESKGVKFSRTVEQPVYVLADQTAIEQITANLLQNAVRYTPAGGSVTVRIGIDRRGYAFIEVEDTGIGISPPDLPRIFERFYRADNARLQQNDGSGLGLSISRLLAVSLGGEIRVESSAGKGSKFTFAMPAIIYSQE